MATLSVTIQGQRSLSELTLGMMIRDRFGQDIFGTNSHHLGHQISIDSQQRKQLTFSLPMQLAPGKYTITLALHEGADHTRQCYHWWDNATSFEVAGIRGAQFGGICNLRPTLEEAPL